VKIKGSDLASSTRIFLIEVHNEVWGMNIVPSLPRVVFNTETFPFDEIPQFPIDHLTVQNLLYYPFLFAIDYFR
jgi:hypothetical protein